MEYSSMNTLINIAWELLFYRLEFCSVVHILCFLVSSSSVHPYSRVAIMELDNGTTRFISKEPKQSVKKHLHVENLDDKR